MRASLAALSAPSRRQAASRAGHLLVTVHALWCARCRRRRGRRRRGGSMRMRPRGSRLQRIRSCSARSRRRHWHYAEPFVVVLKYAPSHPAEGHLRRGRLVRLPRIIVVGSHRRAWPGSLGLCARRRRINRANLVGSPLELHLHHAQSGLGSPVDRGLTIPLQHAGSYPYPLWHGLGLREDRGNDAVAGLASVLHAGGYRS